MVRGLPGVEQLQQLCQHAGLRHIVQVVVGECLGVSTVFCLGVLYRACVVLPHILPLLHFAGRVGNRCLCGLLTFIRRLCFLSPAFQRLNSQCVQSAFIQSTDTSVGGFNQRSVDLGDQVFYPRHDTFWRLAFGHFLHCVRAQFFASVFVRGVGRDTLRGFFEELADFACAVACGGFHLS